jgi:hypothetical protein
MLIFAADYFSRLARRLEGEEQLRQLAVKELAHRLNNKIATLAYSQLHSARKYVFKG